MTAGVLISEKQTEEVAKIANKNRQTLLKARDQLGGFNFIRSRTNWLSGMVKRQSLNKIFF